MRFIPVLLLLCAGLAPLSAATCRQTVVRPRCQGQTVVTYPVQTTTVVTSGSVLITRPGMVMVSSCPAPQVIYVQPACPPPQVVYVQPAYPPQQVWVVRDDLRCRPSPRWQVTVGGRW